MQEEDKDQTAGRRSEDQQDRRAVMKQPAAAQQGGDNHQNQPQKCPRCDSYNTKFCYYNNYSLSQPRYFCKTCRRYWTQGGTLRNVPVGGGCRKGKRTKTTTTTTTSAADNSRPQTPQLPPPYVQPTTGSALRIKEPADNSNLATSTVPTMNSYYQGGGFLSSLAAIQSLNNQTQSFSQRTPANVGGGGFGGSSSTSNMALLQGFHNVPNFGSQQQHHHHQIHQGDQFYQMGGIKGGSQETFLIQPTSGSRTSTTGSSHQNWPHQSFINNTANIPTAPSHGGLWNISSSSSSTNSNAAGSSLNQLNQWSDHHLPEYDPPS